MTKQLIYADTVHTAYYTGKALHLVHVVKGTTRLAAPGLTCDEAREVLRKYLGYTRKEFY